MKEDTIRMAREARIATPDEAMPNLERFAELVRADERKACAKEASELARKWWSIHCATNKHMETTRKAHDDFCALEVTINARGNP